MQLTVPELSEWVVVPFTVAIVAAAILRLTRSSKHHSLTSFPTVGSTGIWGGIKFMTSAVDTAKEGYKKYRDAPFKIATFYYWAVVLSSRTHIEDIRTARDEDLLFLEPTFEDLNAEYTMGDEVKSKPHHITVVRTQLTRNLDAMYPALREEIMTAFDEILDLKDYEWKAVPALATMEKIVSRTSNRAFVGLPLCRNPDWVDLNIRYTIDVVLDGTTLGLFPKFLRPLAARFIANVAKRTRQGLELLRPIIEERRKYMKEYGSNWSEKPKDLLSWIMDEMGVDAPAESIINYILSTNFAAIHTSSNAFTIALYNLAMNPQYVQPLREEVDGIVEKEGWTKASVSKMCKIDSFMKETLRMDSIITVGLARKAGKDYTFSDGTSIPKGTRTYTPILAMHYDDALYDNPEVFNAFRFADMADGDGDSAKHQLVSTSYEFLAFGHGRHACPGRHFAATELKTMLAYVVTAYDVKLVNTTRPRSMFVGGSIRANSKAKVMFRKRVRQDEKH